MVGNKANKTAAPSDFQKKHYKSCFFRSFTLSLPIKKNDMNKIVLITGATSGIGLGCAKKFAENGDKLILTGRNEQRLAEIERELTEKGAQVLTLATHQASGSVIVRK